MEKKGMCKFTKYSLFVFFPTSLFSLIFPLEFLSIFKKVFFKLHIVCVCGQLLSQCLLPPSGLFSWQNRKPPALLLSVLFNFKFKPHLLHLPAVLPEAARWSVLAMQSTCPCGGEGGGVGTMTFRSVDGYCALG